MLLEINSLSVKYGRIPALEDFSMEIKRGEIATVLGANGAGKSTLLKAILGMEKASHGKVVWEGENVTNWSPSRRIKDGLALVPEGRRILIAQTIEENLLLGAYQRDDVDAIRHEMETIYDRFPNLCERRHMQASCLSGGEQQMLAIGRALLSKPDLLMLDEPSLGLSPLFVKQLFKLLRDLNKGGLTILLVEQNTDQALALANTGYVLERGKLIISDGAQKLANDPRLHEAYLGVAAE
ncbi:ABC transporter ATP-binding protein [Falsiruegeria mediterranea]|uniref:High-affinity branched-chain amino acid transport ATP-binding protein LivF n=1 Tax=Falsiruegeria mediterranea M17 TaxID=1200281 RepID=A0A2R8CFA2_9RHOB|nr:ABC transporter ATP-binding protein [Falsiruegeria mediterranea]SPJ30958.1 High-affinity branched-chain amino acid transport ATP-binding protein LivF [Falsiruegeria mediterranea M17]